MRSQTVRETSETSDQPFVDAEQAEQRQTLATLTELWQEVKGNIADQAAVLESAVIALLEGALDEDLRRRARQEAHKLAGTVGTFGFSHGSQLAREIEYLLQPGIELNPTQALRLSELIVALDQELRGSPSLESLPRAVPSEESPLLLLIGLEAALVNRLVIDATARGIRTQLAANATQARQQIAAFRPEAALLDLAGVGIEGGLALLDDLANCRPPLPVLVLAGRDSFAERVEVARLGGQGYLQKPAPVSQILESVMLALQRFRAGAAKVLVVDDDSQVLKILCTLLPEQGIRLTVLEDLDQFWDTLQETEPDLLILDVEMPLNGIDLCRVVRNDPRWSGLPVLFLTVHTDAETLQRIFAAGADDVVGKPVGGPELVTRIVNRLQRARLLREKAETDPLTGLANRRKAIQELNRLLQLADRQRQPFSLAVVDIDLLKQINDRYGYACGDGVLRRIGDLLLKTFRNEDIVARWGSEEFVVGLYGMPRHAGVQRLAEMLEILRREVFVGVGGERFNATFSAGVAEYSEDGQNLQSLYGAADRALAAAKDAGRNRVLPAGWRPNEEPAAREADVVVVESDQNLAGLLRHALENRGFRVQILNDGQAAVNALGGVKPRLRSRLVLLDVNLPGLDGLAVLRHLARDGVLKRSKVIMLTARSSEVEVLEAFKLGAMDHVAKPFSLPVLMQRIRQVLPE